MCSPHGWTVCLDVTGTGCGAAEFQCGDDLHHCIEDVLVCDGHSDCDNGHDEEAEVCGK